MRVGKLLRMSQESELQGMVLTIVNYMELYN